MDEDVLEIGTRRARPWWRAGAVLLLAGGLVAFLLTRGSGTGRLAAPHSGPAAPPRSASAPAAATGRLPPWPQREGVCGNTAFLPAVRADPLTTHTGLRLLVGDRLQLLDVDSHRLTQLSGLPAGEYVVATAQAGERQYALLSPCAGSGDTRTSVVRIADGSATVLARGHYNDLIGGGSHVWAMSYPDSADGQILLDPLDGTGSIRLPTGVAPAAGTGRLIVATSPSAESSYTLATFDPATSTVRTRIGVATAHAVGAGVVLWRGADCGPCPLQVFDLATGARSQVPGAVGTRLQVGSAVVSPDHRYAVMLRERARPGPYAMAHPGNPNELVTVDLVTGTIRAVPDLVLWSKAWPGLAFSADGNWLLCALDEGTGVRVLLWRPGLDRPLAAAPYVAGATAVAPRLTVLSP
jgi:hypothetical protein